MPTPEQAVDPRPAGVPATAVVLAGGRGTRLSACVSDRPKPLAEVDGRPFLDHLFDQLLAAGVRRAVLCTGYLGERIEREYGADYEGLQLGYSREQTPLGTGGALRAALPLLPDDAVLVLNGDSYCDVDLGAFAAASAQSGARAALVAVEVPDTGRFGRVQIGADGMVQSFVEKAAAGGPGTVNAGIYWLRPSLLASLPPATPCSLERDVLPPFCGRELFGFCVAAPFLDIGTPESLVEAQAFFARLQRRRQPGERVGLLVLDRDGTLIAERNYLGDPAGVELLPGVVDGLRAFAARGYELAIVTNQSGIGRGYFDEAQLAAVNGELLRQLQAAGIRVHGIWHCPHRPEDGCGCRKPAPGLLEQALQQLDYLPSQCLVVGDKKSDIDLGRSLGARTVLVRTGYGADTERARSCAPDLIVDGLDQLALQEVGR